MRHFWVFRARRRPGPPPSSAAGVARDGKDGENAFTEAIGCIIDGGQEAKMEILAYGTTMQTKGQIPLRKFGKTDARVSALGLGGHHLGAAKDEQTAVEIVHRAVDGGVTFFDCCWEY